MAKTPKVAVVEDSGSQDSSPLPELKNKKNKGTTNAQPAQKAKPVKKPAAEEDSDDDTPVNTKKVVAKPPRKGSKVSVDEENQVPAKTNGRKASVDKPKKQVKKDDSDEESSEDKPAPVKKQDTKAKPVAKKAAKQESSEQSDDEIVAPKKTAPQPVAKKDAKATKVAAKKQASSSEQSEEEKPVKKAVPAKKPAKVVAKESSDEQSEVKPVKKVQPKKKPVEDSDEEESEEVKPKARKASKQNIKVDNKKKPVAKKESSSEEEEEEPQPKKKLAGKPKKVEQSEEDEEKPQPKRKASGESLTKKVQKPAQKQQPEQQQEEGEFEIAVRGLSFNAYDSDIRDLFSQCGSILNVKMINRPDGKPKGFAFVKFSTRSALNKALELSGSDHLGRSIIVQQSRGKPNGGREGAQGQGRINNQAGAANIETPTLFVGGLSYESTADSMREFFAAVGNVQSARIVTDKQTQRPRGFGYVEFYDVETAKKAYETLNGQYLDGRQIRLDSATQRDRTNAPSGGGRQGGFGGAGGYGGAGGAGGYGGNRNNGNSAVFLSQDDKNAKKGAIAGFQGKKIEL